MRFKNISGAVFAVGEKDFGLWYLADILHAHNCTTH